MDTKTQNETQITEEGAAEQNGACFFTAWPLWFQWSVLWMNVVLVRLLIRIHPSDKKVNQRHLFLLCLFSGLSLSSYLLDGVLYTSWQQYEIKWFLYAVLTFLAVVTAMLLWSCNRLEVACYCMFVVLQYYALQGANVLVYFSEGCADNVGQNIYLGSDALYWSAASLLINLLVSVVWIRKENTLIAHRYIILISHLTLQWVCSAMTYALLMWSNKNNSPTYLVAILVGFSSGLGSVVVFVLAWLLWSQLFEGSNSRRHMSSAPTSNRHDVQMKSTEEEEYIDNDDEAKLYDTSTSEQKKSGGLLVL
jgi:hypothetical protein